LVGAEAKVDKGKDSIIYVANNRYDKRLDLLPATEWNAKGGAECERWKEGDRGRRKEEISFSLFLNAEAGRRTRTIGRMRESSAYVHAYLACVLRTLS